MGRKILYSIHEGGTITRELWERFAAIVTGQGRSISSALADLMRQYITQHERPKE